MALVRQFKKTRKLRGHVSHGHGRVGKHRKHPGGRGKCGGFSHHRTFFTRYHPDFFGKRGKNVYHLNKCHTYNPTITVDKLWSLVEKSGELEKFSSAEIAPVLNVKEFGFFRVLGEGCIPDRPIVVKACSFTPEAERKITEKGGQCILIA